MTTKPKAGHIHCAMQNFKSRNSIRDLCRRIGKERQYNTIKGKLDPNKETHSLNVYELVELTNESGDYSLLYGLCDEVGLTHPMPININRNADINTEFLVATKALGDLAEQINTPKLTPNGVSRLVGAVQSLTASAMTIGYVAEERFGGLSMSVMFGDVVTSGMTGGLLG